MSEWALKVWVWEKDKGLSVKRFLNLYSAVKFVAEFNKANDPKEAYASIEAE